jgi:hypothetical protein
MGILVYHNQDAQCSPGRPASTSAANQISACAAGASVQCPAVRKMVGEINVPLQRHSIAKNQLKSK